MNPWLFKQRKYPGPEGRYLPKVLQQIRSGNKFRVLESFAAPCCVCFSVLPTSSGAHLIPSSSLVELGLSGPHRTNPITTPLGGPASSQDSGGQASLEMLHSAHTRIYLPTLCKTWLSYLPTVSREVKLFAQNHIAS